MVIKSKTFRIGILIVCSLFMMAGVGCAIQSIGRLDFASLIRALVAIVVARAVISMLLFPPVGKKKRKKRKRAWLEIWEFALNMFVSLVSVGLGMWFLALGMGKLALRGFFGDWWMWGMGAMSMLMIAFCLVNLNDGNRKGDRIRRKLTAVVGLAFLAGFVWLWVGGGDAQPMDAPAIVRERPVRPVDSDNAYCACVAATNAICNLPHRKPLEDFDSHEAARIVSSNSVALGLLHQAATCATWYDLNVHESRGPENFPVWQFLKIEQLGLLKVRAEIANGQIGEALSAVRDLARLSRLMLEHAERGLTWVCAAMIRRNADEAIMEILDSHKATDDELVEMAGILSLTEVPSAWDMARLVRVEQANFLEMAPKSFLSTFFIGPVATDSIVGRYLYQPERTRQMYLRLVECQLPLLLAFGYDQLAWAQKKERVEKLAKSAGGVLGRNWFGVVALTVLTSDWQIVDKTKAKAELAHAAARLALAIETYRRKNGRRPDALDQLVPDFIDAVPMDPFAVPNPVAYDPERGVVKSNFRNVKAQH